MAGRVGTRVVIQSVVPASVVAQGTDQGLSWAVRAQLGVTQVASQLESVTMKSPVSLQATAQMKGQVVERVTPQATHVWIRVSV